MLVGKRQVLVLAQNIGSGECDHGGGRRRVGAGKVTDVMEWVEVRAWTRTG